MGSGTGFGFLDRCGVHGMIVCAVSGIGCTPDATTYACACPKTKDVFV